MTKRRKKKSKQTRYMTLFSELPAERQEMHLSIWLHWLSARLFRREPPRNPPLELLK